MLLEWATASRPLFRHSVFKSLGQTRLLRHATRLLLDSLAAVHRPLDARLGRGMTDGIKGRAHVAFEARHSPHYNGGLAGVIGDNGAMYGE